jgi:hypothetical protein
MSCRCFFGHVCLSMGSKTFVTWNVCGLNSRACRDVVREMVITEKPSIICLQETKMNVLYTLIC